MPTYLLLQPCGHARAVDSDVPRCSSRYARRDQAVACSPLVPHQDVRPRPQDQGEGDNAGRPVATISSTTTCQKLPPIFGRSELCVCPGTTCSSVEGAMAFSQVVEKRA